MARLNWDKARREDAMRRGNGQQVKPRKPASAAQRSYLASLADRAGVQRPKGVMSAAVASQGIDRLRKRLGLTDQLPQKRRGPLRGKKRGRR